MKDQGRAVPAPAWVRRFDDIDRRLHIVLMTSFLGLALTGLPLLFSDRRWAKTLSHVFGGFKAAGGLHRTFAVVMVLVFLVHLARIMKRLFLDKETSILWGQGSLVPQPRDIAEMYGHIKWFIGLGERPKFGRFTYWEKFDYWAVFWGMGIIGGSGFVLWFPKFWSRFLTGDLFNVALLVHGEEALLATVFIFTIHFFNGHLRPEKFPMDTVIFTGVLPLEEVRHERPAEYEQLLADGRLEEIAAPGPTPRDVRRGRTIGTIAVTVGLVLVSLTIYALLSGTK